MKKLFNSVAIQGKGAEISDFEETSDVKYAIHEGYQNRPYLHLVISSALKGERLNDLVVDISREDMIDILNDLVDEWPEIIDFDDAPVKQGVQVIPVFS